MMTSRASVLLVGAAFLITNLNGALIQSKQDKVRFPSKLNNEVLHQDKEDVHKDHLMNKQAPLDVEFQNADFGILLKGEPVMKKPKLLLKEDIKDLSSEPTVFRSDKLPSNSRYMASVGNGYLSSVVYSNTVYMNGVYNGGEEHSHRARIPSTGAITLSLRGVAGKTADKNESFALDVGKGVFFYNIDTPTVSIQQRVYAHQYYTRLLVNDIIITRKSQSTDPVTVDLKMNLGPASSDIDFKVNPVKEGVWSMSGPIKTPETSSSGKPVVFVYWTDLPDKITLPGSSSKQQWTFLTSMALDDNQASLFYKLGMQMALDDDKLYQSHVNSWEYKWNRGKIDLEGDLYLSKAIYGSMYYILSSLPPLLTDPEFKFPFFGLSPGGLAQGALGADYQGHVFWDMETWMYPTMLMFYPSLAKEMLLYRTLHLDAAKVNAKDFGCTGAKFPWESAYTGLEVCPGPIYSKNEVHISGDIAYAFQQYLSTTWDRDFLLRHRGFELLTDVAKFWANRVEFDQSRKLYVLNGLEVDPAPDTRDYEQHITGDIAFAIQQYIAATEDLDFITAKQGFDTVRSIADFWKCRAKWDASKNKYVIHDVMGPDEYHQNVNNSVYTNIVAQISLNLPYYAAQFINASVPPEWKNIADNMYIPFDKDKQYHPEYDSYTNGTIVKQADVILLGFPLMINMSEQVRRNDLVYYEKYTDGHGPAMTWGMFSIGWLELGEIDRANSLFNRSFANIQEPFKVWTEVSDGTGAINFCTGMGGFLQAVLFGYGGLRLYQDSLTINPVLPPATTGFNITGINYLGSAMDFVIRNDTVVVTLTEQTEGSPDLMLMYSGQQMPLSTGKPVKIGRGKAKIVPSKKSKRGNSWKQKPM